MTQLLTLFHNPDPLALFRHALLIVHIVALFSQHREANRVIDRHIVLWVVLVFVH